MLLIDPFSDEQHLSHLSTYKKVEIFSEVEDAFLFLRICILSSLKIECKLKDNKNRIDLGQVISVGPGNLAKNNKCRASNKRRASEF